MGRSDRLPVLLAEIAEIAGQSAAIAIAEAHGGFRKKFPSPSCMEKNPDNYARNWLVMTVGMETALQIVKQMFPNGGTADIPSARGFLRWKYVQDNAKKLSVSEMAHVLDVGERTIRRIKTSLQNQGLIT